MLTTNLKLVRNSVTKTATNFNQGARSARDEMMNAITQLAKEEIKGRRPEGQRATPGEPPMNRTGNLRRSIHGQRFDIGFAKYSAIVGPGMIYGRAVELGGEYAPDSWRGTTAMRGFPYMTPALRKFKELAPMILRKHIGGFGA